MLSHSQRARTRARPILAILSLGATLLAGAAACGSDGVVDPTIPKTLTITAGDSQTVTVGAAATPFAVRLTNSTGAPLANTKVRWVVARGGGAVSDTSTTTDSDGRAQTVYTAGGLVDTAVVTAIAGGVLAIDFRAYLVADVASRITTTLGNGAATIAGKPVQLEAKVTDRFGNPKSGVTVNWATGGSGSLSAATGTSDANGKASSTLTLPAAAGTYTATATSPGIGSVLFTVTVI
jgi:hypothetical protein